MKLDPILEEKEERIAEEWNNLFDGWRERFYKDYAGKIERPKPFHGKEITYKDIAYIIRIERPPEGGVYSYLLNYKHPFKGYPRHDIVDKIRILKRIIPLSFKLARDGSVRKMLGMALLIPGRLKRGVIKRFLDLLIGYYWYSMHNDFVNLNSYCFSVREIWEKMTIVLEKIEDPERRNFYERAREVVCMILEFDNAYRFRLQDIFPEINKEDLKKNPVKEMKRILDIGLRREVKSPDMKKKWKGLKKAITLIMKIVPEFREYIVDVILELDMEKIKLDEGDRYFCLTRRDYHFNDVDYLTRMRERINIDKEELKKQKDVQILKE